MDKPIIGVIGGLGPMATAHFMELVTEMTDARRDQENVDMIVYSFPSIPDRTGYILGSDRVSPLPELKRVAQALVRQKASVLVIPCITAHYFHRELQAAVPVPIIDGVARTAELLKAGGIRRAGIMATDGTIRSGHLTMALDLAGIVPILPSRQRQEDVMHLIYKNVKAGKPADMARFRRVRQELFDCGAEVIILGCTELSIIRRQASVGPGFLDMMEVLARETVLCSGRRLKPRYETLVQKNKGGDIREKEYSGIS